LVISHCHLKCRTSDNAGPRQIGAQAPQLANEGKNDPYESVNLS
jgi:hypothetical protein